MSSTGIDPEKVIARMAQQIGSMAAEIAMRDVALEDAQAKLAELQKDPAEEA